MKKKAIGIILAGLMGIMALPVSAYSIYSFSIQSANEGYTYVQTVDKVLETEHGFVQTTYSNNNLAYTNYLIVDAANGTKYSRDENGISVFYNGDHTTMHHIHYYPAYQSQTLSTRLRANTASPDGVPYFVAGHWNPNG